jgi:hypothetical protein
MSILRHKLPKKVSTLEEALNILRMDSGGRHSSWGTIDARYHRIIRHSHYEGCSGGDSSSSIELPIEPSVIAELKMNGYVMGTPHWGYTDQNELRISEHGTEAAWEIVRRQREAEEAKEKEKKNA